MQRKILWVFAVMCLVLGAAAGAYASLAAGGPRMGPQTKITRPALHGYYDGHKDTYLNTDVSSKAEARSCTSITRPCSSRCR
jgi:hypothetical protein